jgi:hypothetical protein
MALLLEWPGRKKGFYVNENLFPAEVSTKEINRYVKLSKTAILQPKFL